MILDEIIALIASIIALIIEVVGLLISTIVNLFGVLIEFILGLFGKKRSIKKVKLFKRKNAQHNHNEQHHIEEENKFNTGEYKPLIYVLIALIVIGYLISPLVFNSHREVTFIAQDGHHLPFASVIVYHQNSEQHRKTDSDGTLQVKKSGLEKIIMSDKRYKKHVWQANEIEGTLTVKRSLLGSSLDILADKLLKTDHN